MILTGRAQSRWLSTELELSGDYKPIPVDEEGLECQLRWDGDSPDPETSVILLDEKRTILDQGGISKSVQTTVSVHMLTISWKLLLVGLFAVPTLLVMFFLLRRAPKKTRQPSR